MFQFPIISVFLPFYHAEQYIENALQRGLEQTFDSFELILINDGSIDKSEEITPEPFILSVYKRLKI